MRTRIKIFLLFVSLLLVGQFTDFKGPNLVCADTSKPLAPLPATSSFIDQIDEAPYYSVEAPTQPPLLRWDFSGKRVYSYSYSQKISSIGHFYTELEGDDTPEPATTSELKGKMFLKSEGDRTARLVLEDLKVIMELDIPESEEPKQMESQAPPMVIQGVQEDGTMKLGGTAQEILLKTLFPIPPTALKVGESVSVPATMPFNAMGSALYVTGTSVTTLTDYVALYGRTCAKLETIIDISTLKVPEELKGTYRCQVRGKSVFFFDVQGKRFLSGRVALIMGMRVEAPMPKMSFPSEAEDAADLPETVRMSMDNDNFISVDYVE